MDVFVVVIVVGCGEATLAAAAATNCMLVT